MTNPAAGSRYCGAENGDPNTSNQREDLDVLVFYVPTAETDAVLGAVFAAGAGAIGDYRECAFVTTGMGQFRPLAGANPAIGEVGALERVAEHRVEVVLPRRLRRDVVTALMAAHPYEEPAFHVLEPVDPEPQV